MLKETSTAESVIESLILIIIWFLAFFGNVSLWFIILRTRSLREQSYHMLLILSFADILVSVVSIPFTIFTVIKGYWVFSGDMCKVVGFLTMLTLIASVMSLGVISLNRYVKICKTRYYQRIYTGRNVIFIAIGVWCLSFLLSTPPLFGWAGYTYIHKQSFCFCDWKSSPSYTVFMVFVCFGGPLSVMTFCYVKILKVFRKSTERVFGKTMFKSTRSVGRVSPDPYTVSHGKISISLKSIVSVEFSNKETVNEHEQEKPIVSEQEQEKPTISEQEQEKPTVSEHEQEKPTVSEHEQEKPNLDLLTVDRYSKQSESFLRQSAELQRASRRKRDEYVLALSLMFVIVVFVICWFPFCVTMFVTVFSSSEVPHWANMFTLLLGYANSCCNPFIYGFMNKRFKTGYRRLFRNVLSACFEKYKVPLEDSSGDDATTYNHGRSTVKS